MPPGLVSEWLSRLSSGEEWKRDSGGPLASGCGCVSWAEGTGCREARGERND